MGTLSQIQSIRQKYRQGIDQGTTQPRASTIKDAPGVAGAFINTELTKNMLNKKQNKASALIPNAALNAAQEVQAQIEMITWVIEIIFIAGEVGTVLVSVQIHHKHKGKSKHPDKIQSY